MSKHAELHVFSGTGNCLRMAEWSSEQMRALGYTTSVIQIGRHTASRVDPKTGLVGVICPTHGFTAPWAAISHTLKMPFAPKGCRAFVMPARAGTKLYGTHLPGFEGTAGYLLALILTLKGYRVRGVMAVDMPSNWLAVHPGMRETSVSTIIARADLKTKHFIKTIIRGHLRFPLGSLISLTLGLLLWQISLGYLLIGRFMLAKMLYADNSCNGCGVCVKQCPAQAISMVRNHPWWSFRCESCMRCIGSCHSHSVQAGQLWLVAAGFAASQPYALLVAGGYTGWLLGHPNWQIAANYPFMLLAIWLMMWPQWALSSFQMGSTILRYTTFTPRWRRYTAPGIRFRQTP